MVCLCLCLCLCVCVCVFLMQCPLFFLCRLVCTWMYVDEPWEKKIDRVRPRTYIYHGVWGGCETHV